MTLPTMLAAMFSVLRILLRNHTQKKKREHLEFDLGVANGVGNASLPVVQINRSEALKKKTWRFFVKVRGN